jgi:Glycosyltransferase family 87
MPPAWVFRNARLTAGTTPVRNSAAKNSLVLSPQTLAFACIAAGALVLAIQCYRYFALGAYFDHIEGNVIVSGWQYVHGAPLYQIEDGAPRFATYYGPLAYLAPIPALLLLGADVATSKLTSILALLGTVLLTGRYFLRHSTEESRWHGVFFLIAALLLFSPVSFWARPDPIETLIVAAAVVANANRWRPLWVGIWLGVAANLKAHAGFYFLPILVDLWWAGGCRALLIAASCSLAVVILPFLAPGISLHDYLAGLVQQVGGRPQTAAQIPRILVTAALLLLPLVIPLAARRQPRRTAIYAGTAIATMALLLYPATFPGAGAYHFLPLVPVLADVRHRLQPQGFDAVLTPFVIMLVGFLAAAETSRMLNAKQGGEPVGAEALALARESGLPTVQVGYGENLQSYEESQLGRTVLALHSYPVLVDAQILMELHQVGIDGSARWIRYLTECRVGRWLLPKDETPFAVTSYFYDGAALFSDAFRQAFLDNYRLVKSAAYFDVWECREHAAAAAGH